MARASGRRYSRDARGRFSSSGATARGGRLGKQSGRRGSVKAKLPASRPGGTVTKGKTNKPATPPKPAARKQRGIESRLERSSTLMLDYRRSQNRVPWQHGVKPMTPARAQHMERRVQQQKQAIANLYGKLSPSNQKRASTKLRRSRLMSG